MSANPPADERDRKRAREVLDTSFAVEAAAGAGKTSVLVSRVLNLVRRTDTRLDRIVAVTFTEKAAGELRVRIREEIEKEISDFGFRIADCAGGGSEIRNPKSEIRNLGRAIEDLGHAPIGTIHGFCARLLRERPVEAGVDPQFAVADELTASLLRDRTWAKWLDAELAAGNPALLRAAARGVRFDGMGNHILGLAEKLMDCRDLLGGLPRAASREPRAASRLGTELLTALDSLIWETQGNAAGGLAEEFLAKLEAARRQLALAGAMSEASGEAAIADLYVPGRFLGQKHWKAKDQHKRAEAIYQKLVADLDAAKQALGQDLAAAIGAALAGFLDAYRAAKDAEGLLDFEDLLLLTRNMLRDSRPARDHFKARFDYILIDEFQDTDPLQVEIAFFLAERADRHAADWQQVELEPGKLFIVGDPKQSIYRFRRADIEVYERAKDAICRQGEPLVLSQSFRPVPGVASAVNAVFSPHFKKPDDGFYQPDYVALDPYRAAVGGRPAAILLYPPPDVAEQLEKADSARTLEARCVAAMIRRIVEEKWLIEDPDKDAQPRTRPVEYRDIAILARTFTSTEHYAEAFSAADVPLRIVGGRHFYVAHEVHALLNVLKAIVNPHDGVALVAALRGPFFGISDDELLLAKCQQGTLTYLGTTIENQESKIANALAVLREFHERRNDAGLALLLQGLFERTKALELFALRPGGEQHVANLLKVLEQARALEATQRVTFRGLVRWLARLQETEVRESESPSSEAGDDFVQFLSIHGAKGLEFPVVFVADISAPEGRATKFIVLRDRPEADGQLAFYVGKKDDAIRTANWPGDEHEKRRADAEAARLFYVATTRARDLLFLLPGWGKKGEGLMRFLGEAANRRGGVEDEDEDEGRGRLGTQTPCGTAYDTATLDLSESSARAFRIRLPDEFALPAA
ncbi:MAG: hypothetical protein FJ291_24545, partial [Planctomycetes bacterium]|nr:hypothetical protein [Planctomycetota bacterium]